MNHQETPGFSLFFAAWLVLFGQAHGFWRPMGTKHAVPVGLPDPELNMPWWSNREAPLPAGPGRPGEASSVGRVNPLSFGSSGFLHRKLIFL